jgi:hypothetical protein
MTRREVTVGIVAWVILVALIVLGAFVWSA